MNVAICRERATSFQKKFNLPIEDNCHLLAVKDIRLESVNRWRCSSFPTLLYPAFKKIHLKSFNRWQCSAILTLLCPAFKKMYSKDGTANQF